MVKNLALFLLLPFASYGVITHSGGSNLSSIIGEFNGVISQPRDNPGATTQINGEIDENGNVQTNDGDSNTTTTTVTDTSIYGHETSYQVTSTVSREASSSGGDNDNDVPTLNRILRELTYLDSDNDGTWLEKIYEELKLQREGNSSDEVTLEDIEFEDESITDRDDDNIFAGDSQNPLHGTDPTGTMPNLSFYVPSIGGGQESVSIDFEDDKYDNLFMIAKLGLTSLVVIGSIRGTSWSAAQILGS